MSESPLQPWTINCLKCLCLMFMRWRGNKQVLHSPKNHRTHVGGRALNMYYFWDGEIPPSVSEASQECKRKSYTLFTHSKIFEKKKKQIVFIWCHKIARRYHQSLLELRDLCDQDRDKLCRDQDEWFIQFARAAAFLKSSFSFRIETWNFSNGVLGSSRRIGPAILPKH